MLSESLIKTAPYPVSNWEPVISTEDSVKTTCPYCGVGCGVEIKKKADNQISVKGDKTHPANLGRLCSKGTALSETIHHNGRALSPKVNGKETDWDTALYTVADQFQQIIAEHGPNSVAFYVSGQLMTEDYYVANKLMKGFIGSGNIDTNSRLCMSSAVAAYKRAFGEDVVPCQYSDLEKADLIVITGSNLAWCHPVIFQRISVAKKNNPRLKVIVIDPRETQTTSIADLHLAIKPGSDGALFNGLLSFLINTESTDIDYVNQHLANLNDISNLDEYSISETANYCNVSEKAIQTFFEWFSVTDKAVTLYSQGINQSSSGTDKANSIINCHLLTGKIGHEGMGPFSITGQPNAMGGREVGGLANQLAAHMDITNPQHQQLVQEFWQSPIIAGEEGLKALDLFDAIEQGTVKAVWIMATNPVVSLADADKVKRALEKCPLVIVSDCIEKTDTTEYADILLPAATWGEREGTVTNSERCISRQRAFLEAAGDAKPDWWIISQVANYMGFAEHFNYQYAGEIFKEHSQLSSYQNNNDRLFNLSAFDDISLDEYQTLQPSYWPCITAEKDKDQNLSEHILSNGKYTHKDNKARLLITKPQSPKIETSEQFPLRLNSGRVRDHWHTMTRTGLSPRLSQHVIEPFVEIHPDDAQTYNITENSLVRVSSPLSTENIVRANISDKQQAGSIFIPIHWSKQFSAQAAVSCLYSPIADPVSGQPESKHGIANIEKYEADWYGFVMGREEIDCDFSRYWTRSKGKDVWRYEIAGDKSIRDWSEFFHAQFDDNEEDEQWVELYDQAQQHYRAIRLVDGHIHHCFFINTSPVLPPRDWLISLFEKTGISDEERASLLKASLSSQSDTGKIVCTCFDVGEKEIQQLVAEHQLKTVEEIGHKCQAGTNCGSCKPELAEFL